MGGGLKLDVALEEKLVQMGRGTPLRVSWCFARYNVNRGYR